MEQEFPKKTISTLVLDNFNDKYFDKVQAWLNRLGCSFTEQNGVYTIAFPEGTTESVAPGMSTQWTYVTEISIPGTRETITRIQAQQLSSQKVIDSIGLPKEITGRHRM